MTSSTGEGGGGVYSQISNSGLGFEKNGRGHKDMKHVNTLFQGRAYKSVGHLSHKLDFLLEKNLTSKVFMVMSFLSEKIRCGNRHTVRKDSFLEIPLSFPKIKTILNFFVEINKTEYGDIIRRSFVLEENAGGKIFQKRPNIKTNSPLRKTPSCRRLLELIHSHLKHL